MEHRMLLINFEDEDRVRQILNNELNHIKFSLTVLSDKREIEKKDYNKFDIVIERKEDDKRISDVIRYTDDDLLKPQGLINEIHKHLYHSMDKKIESFEEITQIDTIFSLFEKLGESIFITDRNNRIIYMNVQGMMLTGHALKDVKGWPVEEVIRLTNQADVPYKDALFNQDDIKDKMVGLPKYTKLINKYQGDFYVSANINYLEYPYFSGLLIIMRDITRIIESELKILQLSNAVEFSPNCVVISDIEGYIEYVNPKFETLTGYSFEEVYKKHTRILKSGETTKEAYSKMWSTIKAGKIWQGEFKNIKKDGSYYWESASIAPIYDKEKLHITNFVALKQDITLQKALEEAILIEQENLKNLLESTPVGIIVLNESSEVRLSNKKIHDLLGDTLVPKGLGYHLDDASYHLKSFNGEKILNFKDMIKEILHNDLKIVGYEMTRTTQQGVQWLRIHAKCVLIQEAPYVLMSIDDITGIKLLERQLETAMEEAKEADKAKTLFLANMSHEIRTPINGIIGMTEITLQSEGLKQEQIDNLQMVRFSSNQLLSIVNDILDISKIDANKVKLESVPFNLKEILRNTVKALEVKALEKDVDLILVVEEEMPDYFNGDPYRIQQILNNIIGNAIKFTEEGYVKIILHCTQKMDSTYRINIEIQDTGIGISEEERAHVFESFTQADSSTTRRFGGTGLGLAITKRLVDLMGGKLSYNSKKNVGTVFTILLYLSEANHALLNENDPIDREHIGEEQPLKILIVEDEKVNRRIVENILKKAGYQTACAVNGLEAVAMYKAAAFDLVLMDIQLPELDGIAATKIIKNYQRQMDKFVPVIALTAYALKGDRERFLDSGMDEYLAKPYEREALLLMISKLLSHEYKELKTLYPTFNERSLKEELISLITKISRHIEQNRLEAVDKHITKIRVITKAFGLKNIDDLVFKLQLKARKEDQDAVKKIIVELKVTLAQSMKKEWR